MKMRSTLIKAQARHTHDCRKYFMSSVDDNNKIVITKSLPSSSSLLSIPYALQHFINNTQYGSVYSTYAAANRL